VETGTNRQLTLMPEAESRDESREYMSCPFCGESRNLDMQLRQATAKRRVGCYDAAIYCRKCYAYGPRVKSEDLGLPAMSVRESPRLRFLEAMRAGAIRAWNLRR